MREVYDYYLGLSISKFHKNNRVCFVQVKQMEWDGEEKTTLFPVFSLRSSYNPDLSCGEYVKQVE